MYLYHYKDTNLIGYNYLEAEFECKYFLNWTILLTGFIPFVNNTDSFFIIPIPLESHTLFSNMPPFGPGVLEK